MLAVEGAHRGIGRVGEEVGEQDGLALNQTASGVERRNELRGLALELGMAEGALAGGLAVRRRPRQLLGTGFPLLPAAQRDPAGAAGNRVGADFDGMRDDAPLGRHDAGGCRPGFEIECHAHRPLNLEDFA